MITVSFVSKKRGYKPSRDKKASGKEIFKQFKESIWAFFLPFGILMGLRMGMISPSGAGAISVVYAVLIGVFIPHDIDYVFMNAFYEEIIRGIIKEADSKGFYILLYIMSQ